MTHPPARERQFVTFAGYVNDQSNSYTQNLVSTLKQLRIDYNGEANLAAAMRVENNKLRERVRELQRRALDLERRACVAEELLQKQTGHVQSQDKGIDALNHDFRTLEKKYFALQLRLRAPSPVEEEWEQVSESFSDS